MRSVELGWSNERLSVGSHVCYFHSDDDSAMETLAFLRVGLDQPGQLCVLFADSSRHQELLDSLSRGYAGSVADRVREGKLAVIGGAPTIALLNGAITQRLDGAVADGYEVIRFLGFLGWGLPGWPAARDLVEFEAGLTEVIAAYPVIVVCTYCVHTLPGPTLIYGGLEAHPLVTSDGRRVARNSLVPAEPAGDTAVRR